MDPQRITQRKVCGKRPGRW